MSKKINWLKITAREYGVQYSEMQIRSLTDEVKEILPFTSYQQIIIPEEGNQCFYIVADNWNRIVKSLHQKYSASLSLLDKFEKDFRKFAQTYLKTSQKLNQLNLKKFSNQELNKLYLRYQKHLLNYCVFVWAGWILNNFVAQKAKNIVEEYLKKNKREEKKFTILESLFRPIKKATVIKLEDEVSRLKGKISQQKLNQFYHQYRWLSCLDIHNRPWGKRAFAKHLSSFKVSKAKKYLSRRKIIQDLKIKKNDLIYLEMAGRLAYLIDARDDYRRQAIFSAQKFFSEIAKRMDLSLEDISYLQEEEIIAFLERGQAVAKTIVKQRQKGFVLYYDEKQIIVCQQGEQIKPALKKLGISLATEEVKEIKGTIACKGKAKGKVALVKGVKDLAKVKEGQIMVAITTHPDYVPAMRKATVIIQKTIDAQVSGIAFTIHSVSKDPNVILIEAGYGLGQALVSGLVTPDSYLINKKDFTLNDFQINLQQKMITREGEKSVPPEKQKQRKLSEEKTIELTKLCLQVEKHFGQPQDIEWALAKDQFYLLQSRPITA